MHSIAAIFTLLITACDCYYLFISKAALRLGVIEDPATNYRRQRLRRINGMVMLLLAASFYAGVFAVNVDYAPQTFAAVWLGVLVLLLVIVILAVADLRLTTKLRGKH